MEKYIVITTTSDSKKVLKNLSDELINSKLVSCAQISKVKSAFRWNGKIKKTKEFKLEVKTRKRLLKKIKSIIEFHHNYDLPEISYVYLYADREFTDWIKNNTI